MNRNPGQTAVLLGALSVLVPLVLGLLVSIKPARGFISLPAVEIIKPPDEPKGQ